MHHGKNCSNLNFKKCKRMGPDGFAIIGGTLIELSNGSKIRIC